jgi:hypothetical protein
MDQESKRRRRERLRERRRREMPRKERMTVMRMVKTMMEFLSQKEQEVWGETVKVRGLVVVRVQAQASVKTPLLLFLHRCLCHPLVASSTPQVRPLQQPVA